MNPYYKPLYVLVIICSFYPYQRRLVVCMYEGSVTLWNDSILTNVFHSSSPFVLHFKEWPTPHRNHHGYSQNCPASKWADSKEMAIRACPIMLKIFTCCAIEQCSKITRNAHNHCNYMPIINVGHHLFESCFSSAARLNFNFKTFISTHILPLYF